MKKAVILFFLCAAVLVQAFSSNSQKIYSVDSGLYKTISRIYILTGRAMPSATGPWSGDELLKMYEAVDRSLVPEYMLSKYDAALEQLTSDSHDVSFRGSSFDFSGTLDADFYIHTYDVRSADAFSRTDINGLADHAFEGRSWWFAKDLNHIVPFFNIEWETFLADRFYFVFDLGLQNAARGREYGELGSTGFNSNIIMLQNMKFDLMVLDIASFPHRAFAAFGGDGWSFEAGRDRLSWGAGATGNLVMSDNFPYHDMVRFTAYGEKFKYTYLVSFFPGKMNYYNRDSVVGYTGTGHNGSTYRLDGLFFYSAHRFEARLFGDKLNFILSEGLVYMSETNNLQFMALSPMFFMHNSFMSDNSNSTLSFELDWTPVKGLSLYGQILLDQFTMPGFEKPVRPDMDSSHGPNGTAYLAGARYITGAGEGVLTINPEIAYVSPFCYLRDGTDRYGMDYTGAIRTRLYAYEDRGLHTDILYEDYVIGYKYGPDCLVGNLSASWEGEKLSLSAGGLVIVRGTHDLWTKWLEIPAHTPEDVFNTQYTGVTSSHAATGNYRYPDAQTARNARWYTLDIGLGAQYRVLDNLQVSLDVDYVYMRNIFNVGGQNASDIQIMLGVKYDCF